MPPKPTRGPGTQPTARVLRALDLLKQMRWTAALRELMAEFKITRGPATKDLAEANRLLEVELAEKLPAYRAQSLERLERALDKAEDRGDLRAFASLQREITRITGIAAPEKIDHTGGITIKSRGEDFEDMTDDQLEALAALDRRKNAR